MGTEASNPNVMEKLPYYHVNYIIRLQSFVFQNATKTGYILFFKENQIIFIYCIV